jgi:hypothetical protein
MRHKSLRESAGEMMHRRGRRMLLVLLCLAAMPMIVRQYEVQEILVGLVALAFGLIVVLLPVVASILMYDGVRRGVAGVKAYAARFTDAKTFDSRAQVPPAHAASVANAKR